MPINQIALQQKIRSTIFETVTENVDYDMGELLTDLSCLIKLSLKATLSAIYTYNKWQHVFTLHPATRDETENLYPEISLTAISELHTKPNWEHAFLTDDGRASLSSYLIPIKKTSSVPGYLFLAFEEKDRSSGLEEELSSIIADLYALLNRYKNIDYAKNKAIKYEFLYKAISNLHSSMESKTILQEVIAIIKEGYPSFRCFFYLIRDFPGFGELPAKELSYDEDPDHQVSLRTLLKEEVQFEEDFQSKQSSIYIPLKGKQGVYGVLQITASNAIVFPQEEVEFLTTLVYTAGNAIENAELYQQSRKMISDLQLINETSHSLNSNLRLTETTAFMKKQLIDTFKAEEVGFVNKEEGAEDIQILEGSSRFFHTEKGKELMRLLYNKIIDLKEALFYGEMTEELSHTQSDYQSIIAVPMIQSNQIKGMIVLLHKEKNFFPFQSFELIQSLVRHSTLAFANSLLREKLEISVVTDYLSGLYTRKYLDEQIEKDMQNGQRGAFLLLDIDDFKKINDTLGHKVGDEIIIQVADLIMDSIGSEDTAARWGGEELAVYMPGATMEEGFDTAQKLVKHIESSTTPKVTVSIGVSGWKKKLEDNPAGIFQRADEALYKAKKSGKNRVEKV